MQELCNLVVGVCICWGAQGLGNTPLNNKAVAERGRGNNARSAQAYVHHLRLYNVEMKRVGGFWFNLGRPVSFINLDVPVLWYSLRKAHGYVAAHQPSDVDQEHPASHLSDVLPCGHDGRPV